MKNLYQKINWIMQQVTTVEKGAKVSMGNSGSYMAVSHDDVTRLLHNHVANVGIVLVPSVIESCVERENFTDNYGKEKSHYKSSVIVELMAINSDNPEEKLSIRMPAIAFDNGDKAPGKSISMATKYCYLKLFMLESVDEEEQRSEQVYHPPKDTRKIEPKKDYKADAIDSAALIGRITKALGALTEGKTKEEKTKFMLDNLGHPYSSIMNMKTDQLEKVLETLNKL